MLHSGIVKDYKEAKKLAFQNFMHLSKLFIELVTVGDSITPEFIKSSLKVTASEKTKEFLFNTDQPAIILTAHYGSWEISGRFFCILSGTPLLAVMRPFDNYKIGNYFYKLRKGYGLDLCEKQGAIKKVLKRLKNGGRVCFFVDQHASHKDGVMTQFFGQPASTHSSAALLHLKTQCPIFAFVVRNTPDGYEMVIKDAIEYEPFEDKEKAIINVSQKFTNDIEAIIREEPLQWVWAPRRWLNIDRKSRSSRE